MKNAWIFQKNNKTLEINTKKTNFFKTLIIRHLANA